MLAKYSTSYMFIQVTSKFPEDHVKKKSMFIFFLFILNECGY